MFEYRLNTRKNQFGEYVIRCFLDGKRYPDGDYFTDDKQDATDTLNALNQTK